MSAITVYTTAPNATSAEKITNALLRKRLIACANIIPIKSKFIWDDKVATAREIGIFMKSKKALWPKIKKEIENIHPYTQPVIEYFPVNVNNSAQRWLDKVL